MSTPVDPQLQLSLGMLRDVQHALAQCDKMRSTAYTVMLRMGHITRQWTIAEHGCAFQMLQCLDCKQASMLNLVSPSKQGAHFLLVLPEGRCTAPEARRRAARAASS